MLDDDAAALLQRLYEETALGRLVWVQHADGYFVACFGPGEEQILIRRVFIEVVIGVHPADRSEKLDEFLKAQKSFTVMVLSKASIFSINSSMNL